MKLISKMPVSTAGVILLLLFLIWSGSGPCRADGQFTLRVEPWMSAHGVDKFGQWAEFTVGGVTQRLRWIKPGTFLMGSPDDELGHNDNEKQHRVTLTKGFWMADSICTQSLWLAVTNGSWRRSFYGHGDPRVMPADNVTWNECQDFFKQLNSELPGLNASLPTEAQWEYACRAGTTGPFDGNVDDVSWNFDNSGGMTHPVKTKAPNPWGLYDMHGNTFEWCQDTFEAYSGNAEVDPVCTIGTGRVIRGGSYYYHWGYLRAASRFPLDPGAAIPYVSMRICAAGP